MSIAKIVVPLTGGKRDRVALETAFVAARPHNAHAVAVYVNADPRLAFPYMGAPLSPDVIQSIIDSTATINRAAAQSARVAMSEAAAAFGAEVMKSPARAKTVSCSFHEMEGYFPQCVADAAQLSDLIVFGPVTTADGPDLADAFVETLTKTERPVLLAARVPKSLTNHVTVGWDGSAAAARALIGAMPFLQKASRITLLSCRTDARRQADFAAAQEYLALHGLSCSGSVADASRHNIGETLLDAASKNESDLLVMGGFGHSHVGEVFFGGVTQHVRWNAELPVLMVH